MTNFDYSYFAIDFSTPRHVGQEETPSRNPACTLSKHFRNGSLPSRFSGKKEVEKRERNNTPGRAFSVFHGFQI